MTADVAKTVASLRDTFDSGQTRPAGWRKAQLRRLEQLLTEGEDEIAKAMRDDLGKAPAEGWVTEVRLVQRELTHMIGHLDAWMRPHHVHVPVVLQPARAKILPEPLGVALVIAPWNY
ncbi:MAG TPA: aldehyde dehydrogenase family protein, partial [Actinomycetota bacterium]|nr:aldehyde dehydrogenase family protein [Actinomycetota bacterium]